MTPVQFKHEMGKDMTLLWLCILMSIVFTWALFFHLIEGHTWFDSVYFVIMTMTTVGYGDIVPHTIIGKILTMIFALTGAPLFIFIGWYLVEQRITWLVKAYVKHHTSQMLRLEDEVEKISENVGEITQEVGQITEDVEVISENVGEIEANTEGEKNNKLFVGQTKNSIM
jgi:hypothetical protein